SQAYSSACVDRICRRNGESGSPDAPHIIPVSHDGYVREHIVSGPSHLTGGSPMARARLSPMTLATLASVSLLCGYSAIGHAAEIPAGKVAHVLLISIDGLHAGDLGRFAKEHPDSAMASLMKSGVTYPNAYAP